MFRKLRAVAGLRAAPSCSHSGGHYRFAK
jgi:hypothetical protein